MQGPQGHDRELKNVTSADPFRFRQTELRVLEGALETAHSQQSATVLLVGEAGIGKTHLLTHFIEAYAQDAAVLQLCPTDTHIPEPHAALGDLVNSHTHTIRENKASFQATVLAEAVRSGAKHREILRLFDELIAQITAVRTTILILDATEDPRQALLPIIAHTVRRSAHRTLLTLLTTRPDHMVIDQILEQTNAIVLPIEPLIFDESIIFLNELTRGQATEKRLAQIAGRSGGNPLFLRELAEAAKHAGDFTLETAPTLSSLLLWRIERLPPNALAFLRVAAMSGCRASPRFCALAAGLDPDDALPLQELHDAQLILESTQENTENPRRNTLAFANPLLPEMVRTAMPEAILQDFHRRIATLLSLLDAAPIEIAPHALAGVDTKHPWSNAVVELAIEAAETAIHQGRPAIAVDFSDKALNLHPSLTLQHKCLTVKAEALLYLGMNNDAYSIFQAIVQRATREFDPGYTERGKLGLARSLQRTGKIKKSLTVFESCQGIDAERGKAETLLALGHVQEARNAALLAVTSARKVQDKAGIASSLANQAMVEAVTLHPDSLRTAVQATQYWRELGEDFLDFPPLLSLSLAQIAQDQFQDALTSLQELQTWVDNRGLTDIIPRIVRTETIAAFLSCEWTRMEIAIATAAEVKRNLPNHEMGPIWAAATAIATARDNTSAANTALARSENALRQQSTPFDRSLTTWWHGTTALLKRDFETAQIAFTQAAEGFRKIGSIDLLVRTLPVLVLARAATGKDPRTHAREHAKLAKKIRRPSIQANEHLITALLATTTEKKQSSLLAAVDIWNKSEHRFGLLQVALASEILKVQALPTETAEQYKKIWAPLGPQHTVQQLLDRQPHPTLHQG